jgi:hypothetical protein
MRLNRSGEEIAAQFEANVRTTPERAAEIIHRGVDAGKARILVGPDAYVFDALTRIAPTNYFRILSLLPPFRGASTRADAAGAGR